MVGIDMDAPFAMGAESGCQQHLFTWDYVSLTPLRRLCGTITG